MSKVFKIIHVIPTLQIGGAESLVLNLCRELNRQNIKVTLVVLSAKIELEIENDTFVRVIPTCVQPHFFGKSSCKIEEFQSFLKRFNPDIVHTHLWESEVILAHTKIPKKCIRVCHFHDPMVQTKRLSIRNLFSKVKLTNYRENKLVLAQLNGAKVISVSDHIKKIATNNWPNVKHYTLYNAIDLIEFKSINRQPSPGPILLLQVGSLVENKNNFAFIQLCHFLKSKNYSIKGLIVGDGPLRALLQERINSLQLKNDVVLYGATKNVAALYADSEIYIHTAFQEAFGLTILEAMASGLPVVSYNGGGNAELINEGVNGYLIATNQFNELLEKVIHLIDNPLCRKEMGENARNFAEGFGIQQYVDRLIEIYQA